ncbi:MAG: hypothetical protein WCS31_13095 [Verrucomicrobiae bacterium]
MLLRLIGAAGIFYFATAPHAFRAAEPDGAPVAAIAPAEKENAFRGVPFGTPLAEVQKKWELEPLDEAGPPGDPLKLFIRNDETKSIGNIALQEIVYYFFDGKFYAVQICAPDSRQTEILRQALDIAFGGRPHASKEGDSFVWPGKSASAQLMVNPGTGEGRALIFNNDLQADYEKYSLGAAKKAAAEF